MLATSSFKDELARFDFELTNAVWSFWSPKDRAKPCPRLKAELDHIQRWAKDRRTQEVWIKIKKNSPGIDPQHFIWTVHSIFTSAADLASNKANLKGWMARHRTRASKLFSSNRSPSEIAAELEQMAGHWRWLDEAGRGFALGHESYWSTMRRANSLLTADDLKISRKDQRGSRARKLFARQLGRIFYELCGQWHDQEVAVLTEVAFPGKKLDVVDIQAMRRPTTKRERLNTPK
jgi:hypothetical protein